MRWLRVLGAGCFCLFLNACTSMSALQTARVLPEGTHRFLVGAGFFRTPEASPSDPSKVTFPFLEVAGRFGFLTDWDVGLRYTMPGMFTGDLKFNLVNDPEFAFALGAGVGFLGVKSGASDTTHFQREILDVLIPMYISYDFAPEWGVYVSPRVVFRFSTQDQNLVGGAVGIRWGNTWGVCLEAGGAADISSKYTQYQVNAGFFFGSAPSVE